METLVKRIDFSHVYNAKIILLTNCESQCFENIKLTKNYLNNNFILSKTVKKIDYFVCLSANVIKK